MTIVLFGALLVVFGIEILPWLLVQAVVGFSLLEVVNYLEHYGLRRQWDDEKDRYELCRPEHSWNSNNVASNVFLYHLQRHSDHHANPVRRYQALRHFEEVPELPSGYATMIVLAYATPLWRRTMDPKVAAHYGGDIRLANLQPRKREKLIAKWGTDASASPVRAQSDGRQTASDVHLDDDAAAGEHAHRCPGCGYTYVEEAGAPREGFPAGTAWADIPSDWICPDCGVREKSDFVPAEAAASAA